MLCARRDKVGKVTAKVRIREERCCGKSRKGDNQATIESEGRERKWKMIDRDRMRLSRSRTKGNKIW